MSKIDRPARALNGWPLEQIVRLDTAQPGFLRLLLKASDLRRQAVFLALNKIDIDEADTFAAVLTIGKDDTPSGPDDPVKVIADRLLRFRVKDILTALLGGLPQGLIGSLSRSGPDPLDRRSYTKLELIHCKAVHREKAKLLSCSKTLNDMLIEVVWRLPDELMAPISLTNIANLQKLELYRSAINLIRRLHPRVSSEDIRASLKQHPKESNLTVWIEGWVERASFLPLDLPIVANDHLKPLVTVSQLVDASRRFDNCLKTKIKNVVLGRACYYEYAGGEDSAIVELAALSQGRWVIEGIFGFKNATPSTETTRNVRSSLENAGVLVAARHTHSADLLNLAKLFRVWDFDGGLGLDFEDHDGSDLCAFDPAGAGLVRVA